MSDTTALVAALESLLQSLRRSAGAPAPAPAAPPAPEQRWQPVMPLAIEIGLGLLPLVDPNGDQVLVRRVTQLRAAYLRETGVHLGLVELRDHADLHERAYRVLVNGEVVAAGELHLHRFLAVCPGERPAALPGLPTTDPAYRLPASWITPAEISAAQALGCTVVDPTTVVLTHLGEVVRRHAHELFGYRQLGEILEALRADQPLLLRAVEQSGVRAATLLAVCRALIRDELPLLDAAGIVGACAEPAGPDAPVPALVERARLALARTITRQATTAAGELPLLALAPALERLLDATLATPGREFPASLMRSLLAQLDDHAGRWPAPLPVLVVVPGHVRGPLATLLHRYAPTVRVVAAHELAPAAALGVRLVKVGDLDAPGPSGELS